MNSRQKINPIKFITVFAITTLVFVFGILVGNYFSTQKLSQIDDIGQELKTDTAAMELQYDLIAEDPCSHLNSTPLADTLYDMASKLDYMENRVGEDDKNVKALKEYYSLLELRHWLFMQKTNKQCNQTSALILFFYSNEEDCSDCKEQGFILTWARRNYENVYIYSFDYNIQNDALDTVKRIFKIEGTPAVVINKQTYNEFVTRADIEEILHEQGVEMIK